MSWSHRVVQCAYEYRRKRKGWHKSARKPSPRFPTRLDSKHIWSANQLRNKLIDNATHAEINVYGLLKELNVKFKFQCILPTQDQHFKIVDFLVYPSTCIEVDGPYHQAQREKDHIRQSLIKRLYKYRFIKLTNHQALKLNQDDLIYYLKLPRIHAPSLARIK